MIAARLCSAERCGALVYGERRWCPTHRPCREPPPRTIVHRLIRLIQQDPTLTNRQLMDRLRVYPQQIVQARRITGIPDPGHDAALLPLLHRPPERARAVA